MARWTLADLIAELETALNAIAGDARTFFRWFRTKPSAAPVESRVAPFGEHEKVEESKFFPPLPPQALKLEDGEVPVSYGRTRLVMLVVGLYRVHAYWEVTPDKLAEAEKMIRFHANSARPVLRFYDAAVADAADADQTGWFDVDVDLQPRNWYVQLWSADKTYTADLGLRGEGGRFVSLARSNLIRTPRAWPVVGVVEHFMRVEQVPKRAESVPPPVYVKPRRTRLVSLPTPAPAGAEPACDSAPTVGVGTGQWLAESRLPAPVNSAETLLKKLTEFHALRQWRGEPLRAGEPPVPAIPAAYFGEPGADLTEMAEQRFVLGLSSTMAPRTRAED